jgi:predicted nuclease of predicted toxin-antitoxin system
MIWLDAHLSPILAIWIGEDTGFSATHLRSLGLRDATDRELFAAARAANVVLITKDADFVDLLARLGPPPAVIWLTCGNTSSAALRGILATTLPAAMTMIEKGEPLVEIANAHGN